jgi:hypothetical protein
VHPKKPLRRQIRILIAKGARLAVQSFGYDLIGSYPNARSSNMIRFQIIERSGANLHRTLVDAMRAGELRTFEAQRRGRRIQHKNLSYPGWMNWSVHDGMINCEVVSPYKPGREWQLFSAFLGRLADRYSGEILGINVQFPGAADDSAKLPKPRRRVRRKRPGKR